MKARILTEGEIENLEMGAVRDMDAGKPLESHLVSAHVLFSLCRMARMYLYRTADSATR